MKQCSFSALVSSNGSYFRSEGADERLCSILKSRVKLLLHRAIKTMSTKVSFFNHNFKKIFQEEEEEEKGGGEGEET